MSKRKHSRLNKETTDFTARFMLWMAAAILLFTFTYIFCITFIEIPESSQRYADTIIGFLLGTLVATVVNYFYGSSKSSNDKNKALEVLTSLQSKINDAVDSTRTEMLGDDEETDSSNSNDNGSAKDSDDSGDDSNSDFDGRTLGDSLLDQDQQASSGDHHDDVYANDDDLKKANS